MGAHYDVYGPYPGADDNASGVAGLIELAALLGQTPKLPCRVDLVAFALEESPFFGSENMGSAHHAAALRAAEVTVRAMIALEMIGYFSDQPDSQTLPLFLLRPFYPSTGNFIAVVGRPSDWRILRPIKGAMRTAGTLPVFSLSAPTALAGIDWSDHRSYWINDYPAVMVTDTSFYRNQNYHTDKDRPETLDYRRMAAVVESVYQAVQTLAADP